MSSFHSGTCPKCKAPVVVKSIKPDDRSVTSKITFACVNKECGYEIVGDF